MEREVTYILTSVQLAVFTRDGQNCIEAGKYLPITYIGPIMTPLNIGNQPHPYTYNIKPVDDVLRLKKCDTTG